MRRQTIQEFEVSLEQLHNDSTTITFSGNDSDAATEETRGGWFITVLPRTRGEDKIFRQSLRAGKVSWRTIHEKIDPQDEQKKVLDCFSATNQPATSAEGYRLLWYPSSRKAELDAAARANRIARLARELDNLRQRLTSPRTRHRVRDKVAEAVEEILTSRDVKDWISGTIEERLQENYRQAGRGRPTKETRYTTNIEHR